MPSKAVSGTSLITSASRLMMPDATFTYRHFRTLCDFMETYVLHDELLVIGPFPAGVRDTAQAFIKILNGRRPGSVKVLEGESLNREVRNSNLVNQRLRAMMDSCFDGRIQADVNVLLPKQERERRSDDADIWLWAQIRNVLETSRDLQALADLLIEAYRSPPDQSVVKHAFRAFVYASVAETLAATVVYTGLRKAVGLLIRQKGPPLPTETVTYEIYKLLDAIGVLSQKRWDPQHLVTCMRLPLLPWKTITYLGQRPSAHVPEWRLGAFLDVLSVIRDEWKRFLQHFDQLTRNFEEQASAPVSDVKRAKLIANVVSAANKSLTASRRERVIAELDTLLSSAKTTLQTTDDNSEEAVSLDSSVQFKFGQLIFNLVKNPHFTADNLALWQPLKSLKRLFMEQRPSVEAFDLFNISVREIQGRRIVRDLPDLENYETMLHVEAFHRLKR